MSDSYKVYASQDYVNSEIAKVNDKLLPEKINVVLPETVLECKTNAAGENYYVVTSPLMAKFVDGKKYTITYNGTEYECQAYDMGLALDGVANDTFTLGNLSAAGLDFGNSDAPFFASDMEMKEGEYLGVVPLDGSTSITLSIVEKLGPYLQLVTDKDGKTIWEEKLAYKHTTIKTAINLTPTDLIGEDEDGDGTTDVFYLLSLWAVDLVAGSVATVTYNGTVYECAAVDYSQFESDVPAGAVALGNLNAMSANDIEGSNPDAPFVLMALPNAWAADMGGMCGMFVPLDGATAVTLSIETTGEQTHVKTIAPEYLPSEAFSPAITITIDDGGNMSVDTSFEKAWEYSAAQLKEAITIVDSGYAYGLPSKEQSTSVATVQKFGTESDGRRIIQIIYHVMLPDISDTSYANGECYIHWQSIGGHTTTLDKVAAMTHFPSTFITPNDGLNGKYLKYESGRLVPANLATPDWNAAEGEDGHILNRTHYQSSPNFDPITLKLSCTEIASDGITYAATYTTPVSFVTGRVYNITWNGVTHKYLSSLDESNTDIMHFYRYAPDATDISLLSSWIFAYYANGFTAADGNTYNFKAMRYLVKAEVPNPELVIEDTGIHGLNSCYLPEPLTLQQAGETGALCGSPLVFGDASSPFGDWSFTYGDSTSKASGKYAFAMNGKARGEQSVAFGGTADKAYSSVIGDSNKANAGCAHAQGCNTEANGIGAHAEGRATIAGGSASHAEGHWSAAEGYTSHAEGYATTAQAEQAHAEGYATLAQGKVSHSEGYLTFASGERAHAEGSLTVALGAYAHAENRGSSFTISVTKVENPDAIQYTTPDADRLFVGQYLRDNSAVITLVPEKTIGDENGEVVTYTIGSVSKPIFAKILEITGDTITLDKALNAKNKTGDGGMAVDALVGGANGTGSHVEGFGTLASSEYQHVQGTHNVEDAANVYAHIVGNGSAYDARSNAHVLDWKGNARFAGDVYVNGTGTTGDLHDAKKVATEEFVNDVVNTINVIPDWNENNPDSPAYIKNRTHYEEMGVKGTLLAERSPDSIEEGAAYFMYPCLEAEPQAGMTYKINWNGTEYLCVALDSQEAVGEAGYVLLGNIGMISGGTPTAEPFVIMMPYEEIAAKQGVAVVCVMLDGATQLTLSISYEGDVIHKLDNKYLNLSAYAKLDYVNEVKASMEGLFANYYPKTTIDNKFNNEYFTTGGISDLTGRNEGYQAAVGQIEELITYVDIPAAAANDEYLLTLGYSSSKTDLMCQYQTEGGIVAGEMRKLKFYVRRIGKHIFVKIYKPSANGFTDVIEDVLFIDKSDTQTNPRYVRISTVSGNNFPDGATIKMYQRTAAKAVN